MAASSDGSTVFAGITEGNWNATNAGSQDFAAVKVQKLADRVFSRRSRHRQIRNENIAEFVTSLDTPDLIGALQAAFMT